MEQITYTILSLENKESLFKALKEVDEETGAHDPRSSDEGLWNWNYLDLPLKNSVTCVANHGENIIGFYHLPIFEAKIGDKLCKLGHVQSVGVLQKYRKNKVFQNLANFANLEADKQVDILYAFPNEKSIHTFIKYCKFEFVAELPMYILPLKSKNLISSVVSLFGIQNLLGSIFDSFFKIFKKKLSNNQTVFHLDEINEEVEDLFLKFGKEYKVAILRNKEYLNWRYRDVRKAKYSFFGLKTGENLVAVVVIREEDFLSNKGYVVMDVAFNTIEDLQALLLNIDQESLDEQGSFMLLSGNFNNMKDVIKSGFIRVPSFMVPRKLNFLVRWIKSPVDNQKFSLSSYLVTLGDWDVF